MSMGKGLCEAYRLSVTMILAGLVVILLGQPPVVGTTLGRILQFLGTTLVGVFAVSLVYQAYIARIQSAETEDMLLKLLKRFDSIQASCMKLGITGLFETRKEYTTAYPLADVISQCPQGGRVRCIARSLSFLLRKTDDFKKGLEKGLKFELACVDPKGVSPSFRKLAQLHDADIEVALQSLREILAWAVKAGPKGSLELRYHSAGLPDTAFIFTKADGQERLDWELNFARDFTGKRVLTLEASEGSLGEDLKRRYSFAWDDAIVKIRFSDGKIQVDAFHWELVEGLP